MLLRSEAAAPRQDAENQVLQRKPSGEVVARGKRRAFIDLTAENSEPCASSRQECGKKRPAPAHDAAEALAPKVPRTRTRAQARAWQQQYNSSGAASISGNAAVPLPDIDAGDRHNPLAAAQYVNDVYAYFRRAERRFRIPPAYMDAQADVNEKMRAVLVDWLISVHLKFRLMPETLFMSILMVDRFLAVRPVQRRRLQLVGVAAMVIASKYEELWAPQVQEFVAIADKAYTKKEVLGMERDMLCALHFQLTLPTIYQFLARLLKAANAHFDKPFALFVAYCAELCLVDYDMLKYSPSQTAAAIMYVAMCAMRKADPYPYALERHAHHTKASILHVAQDVVRLLQKAPNSSLKAVHGKYSSPKYLETTSVPVPVQILHEVIVIEL